MNDKDYFSHLYEIASHLNREFSLPSALRKSLEKMVEILDMETGWIWLTEADNKTVFLAASHNLPSALSDHPERLSGWCYCIKQYLTDDIDQAMNISEIACTRLKDIITGTEGLKYHATIPIITNGQKVGLMNLLSKETRQLDERELALLNTISELVGVAIQRSRLWESYEASDKSDTSLHKVIERVLGPQIEKVVSKLNDSEFYAIQQEHPKLIQHIGESLRLVQDIQQQVSLLLKETEQLHGDKKTERAFKYPASPLTKREMEVLSQIKNGHTNKQIADQLFIAERTVKFHVTSIFSKLSAETRTEAVNTAMKRGMLGV